MAIGEQREARLANLTDREDVGGEAFLRDGPFVRTDRLVTALRPRDPRVFRRAVHAVLIGWVPLAVLAAVQLLLLGDLRARSFLFDYGVHARFLVAVPLLIIAEATCLPRLGWVAHRFAEGGIVSQRDLGRFDDLMRSIKARLRSPVVEAVIIVMAYAVTLLTTLVEKPLVLQWRELGLRGTAPSLAGWWATLISYPLLLALWGGWLRRQFLWGRFLREVSRLDLQLVPPHPDGLGGISFVHFALGGYWPISLALGVILAGAVANQVLLEGAAVLLFFRFGIGAAILVLILLVFAPLMALSPALRRAKRRGRVDYGLLGSGVGLQFERRWLSSGAAIDEGALGVTDFSATTDLYSIVDNVNRMNTVPLSWKDLIPVVLPALAPFVPLAFAIMPLDQILDQLQKLLGLLT